MLPIINGKTLLQFEEEDLQVLIDEKYRENEYVDYKKSFNLLDIPKSKTKERDHEKAEFRSDVCAFANAGGGYLVFGISEDQNTGIPAEIVGIKIQDEDRDHFERDVRNWLQPIVPRIPTIQFGYVPLRNGNTVVVLYVHHDHFAPYIHLENENDYRIYKRMGNEKRVVSYNDLHNMFLQSALLDKEIESFRKDRIDHYYDKEFGLYGCEKFLLLHIIPETFLDSSYDNPIYYLGQKKHNFLKIFAPLAFPKQIYQYPTVSGLKFGSENNSGACYLFNNGVTEAFIPLDKFIIKETGNRNATLKWKDIWTAIDPSVTNYIDELKDILLRKRVFVCISIIGCKDLTTADQQNTLFNGFIDQNKTLLPPVAFDDLDDIDIITKARKALYIELVMAMGLPDHTIVKKYLDEIYGKENR